MIFQPNNFKLLCVKRGTDPDFSSLLYSEPLFFFFGHNFEKKENYNILKKSTGLGNVMG